MFVFSRQAGSCETLRTALSVFDPIFRQVTDDLYVNLASKVSTLPDALDVYNSKVTKPPEKEFLNLISVLGKDNVSEVGIFNMPQKRQGRFFSQMNNGECKMCHRFLIPLGLSLL
jgi:hypothetical protein